MSDLVQRQSGIVVPAHLAQQLDQARPGAPPLVYDPDGRRRVVIEKQQVESIFKDFAALGLAFFMGCRPGPKRADGVTPCGHPMRREADGGPDPGYGCLCTRIYFV
jgi:hypothetical protein